MQPCSHRPSVMWIKLLDLLRVTDSCSLSLKGSPAWLTFGRTQWTTPSLLHEALGRCVCECVTDPSVNGTSAFPSGSALAAQRENLSFFRA